MTTHRTALAFVTAAALVLTACDDKGQPNVRRPGISAIGSAEIVRRCVGGGDVRRIGGHLYLNAGAFGEGWLSPEISLDQACPRTWLPSFLEPAR